MSSEKSKKGFMASLKLNDISNILLDENLEKQINEKIEYIKKRTFKESNEGKNNLKNKKNSILDDNDSFESFDGFVAEKEIDINDKIRNNLNSQVPEVLCTDPNSSVTYGHSATINSLKLGINGPNALNNFNNFDTSTNNSMNIKKKLKSLNSLKDNANNSNENQNKLVSYKRNQTKIELENCIKKIQKGLLRNSTSTSSDPKFSYFTPDSKGNYFSQKAEKGRNQFALGEVRKKQKSNTSFSHPFKSLNNINNMKLKANFQNKERNKFESNNDNILVKNAVINNKKEVNNKYSNIKKITQEYFLDSSSNLVSKSEKNNDSVYKNKKIGKKKFSELGFSTITKKSNFNKISNNIFQLENKELNTDPSIFKSSTIEKNIKKNIDKFSSTKENLMKNLDADCISGKNDNLTANENKFFLNTNNTENSKINSICEISVRSILVKENQAFKKEEKDQTNHLEISNKEIKYKSKPNNNTNDINTPKHQKAIRLQKNNSETCSQDHSYLNKNFTQEFESDGLFDFNSKRKTIFIDKRIVFKGIKVYDSLSDDEFELEEREFILRPNAFALILLDFFILLGIAYSTLMVPMRLIFYKHTNLTFIGIEMFIDFCLLMDFILSFFTGFYDFEENYNQRFSYILLNYTRNYLIMDMLTLIPFGSLLEINQYLSAENVDLYPNFDDSISDLFVLNNSSFVRLLKVFRLIKLVKVFSNNKFLCFLKDFFMPESSIPFYIKASLYYFYFLIITHILSCSFIFLGTVSKPNWIINAGLTDKEFGHIYLAAIYFNHLTIMTIGYGDILAKNSYERIYNILLMIFGVMLYSFVLSWISNLVVQNNEKSKKFDSKKDYLNQLCLKYDVMNSLFTKISVHLRHEMQFFKADRNQLLNELPNSLKNEVVLEMYSRNIKSINFLKYCQNTDFVIQVVLALRPTKYYKDEIILNEGDLIEELLILKNGILSIEKGIKFFLPSAPSDKGRILIPPQEILTLKILNLRKNDHFGDSLMIQNLRSPVSLRVKSKYAELLLMAKLELIKLSGKYPEIYNKIFKISDFNVKQIERTLMNAEEIIKVNSLKPEFFDVNSNNYVGSSKKDKKAVRARKSIIITNLADYHLRGDAKKTGAKGRDRIEEIKEEDEEHLDSESADDKENFLGSKIYDDHLEHDSIRNGENAINHKDKDNIDSSSILFDSDKKAKYDVNQINERDISVEHEIEAEDNFVESDDPIPLLCDHKSAKNGNWKYKSRLSNRKEKENSNNNNNKYGRRIRSNFKPKNDLSLDQKHYDTKKHKKKSKNLANDEENKNYEKNIEEDLFEASSDSIILKPRKDSGYDYSKTKSNNNNSTKDKKLASFDKKFNYQNSLEENKNLISPELKSKKFNLESIDSNKLTEVPKFEINLTENNLVPKLKRNASSINEELFTDEIVDFTKKSITHIIPHFLSSSKENLDRFIPHSNNNRKSEKDENDKETFKIKTELLNININKNVNNYFYTPDFNLRTVNDLNLTSEEIKMLLFNRNHKNSLNCQENAMNKNNNFSNSNFNNQNDCDDGYFNANNCLEKVAIKEPNNLANKQGKKYICEKCLAEFEQPFNMKINEKIKQQSFEIEIKSNKINKNNLFVEQTNYLEFGTNTFQTSNYSKEDCFSEFNKLKEYLIIQKLSIKSFIEFLEKEEHEKDDKEYNININDNNIQNKKHITFKNQNRNSKEKKLFKDKSLSIENKNHFLSTEKNLNMHLKLNISNSKSLDHVGKRSPNSHRNLINFNKSRKPSKLFSRSKTKKIIEKEIIKDEVNNILKSSKQVINAELDKDSSTKFFENFLEDQDHIFKRLIKKEEWHHLKSQSKFANSNKNNGADFLRCKSRSLSIKKSIREDLDVSISSTNDMKKNEPKSNRKKSICFKNKQTAVERNFSYKNFLENFDLENKVDENSNRAKMVKNQSNQSSNSNASDKFHNKNNNVNFKNESDRRRNMKSEDKFGDSSKMNSKSQSSLKFVSDQEKKISKKRSKYNNELSNKKQENEICDSVYKDLKRSFKYHHNLIIRLDYLFKSLEIKTGAQKSRKAKYD